MHASSSGALHHHHACMIIIIIIMHHHQCMHHHHRSSSLHQCMHGTHQLHHHACIIISASCMDACMGSVHHASSCIIMGSVDLIESPSWGRCPKRECMQWDQIYCENTYMPTGTGTQCYCILDMQVMVRPVQRK